MVTVASRRYRCAWLGTVLVGKDYCLVIGGLNNLCAQIKQYGMLNNQVVNDLEGSFAFVVFDSKACTVFTALGSDKGVKLYWGIAADGSVAISDDL
ncbi:hypothetical protein R6Q57_016673 [Mikania cordata]